MQAGVRTHSSRFAEPSFPLYVSMTRWDICAHGRVGEVNARRLTQVASIGASEMRSCGAQIRTLPVWHQSVYVALTSIAALATALYVTPATMVWSRHRQMMRPTSRANPSVALGLRMVDRAGGMSWNRECLLRSARDQRTTWEALEISKGLGSARTTHVGTCLY